MKRTLLISALSFSITGCGLMYDNRQPPRLNASITTINNNVCVLVQPESDEIVASVYIEEAGSDKNRFSKNNLNAPIKSDQCVSDFGYKFEPGITYHFTTTLESPSKKKQGAEPYARFYVVSFILQNNNGKLEATTPY